MLIYVSIGVALWLLKSGHILYELFQRDPSCRVIGMGLFSEILKWMVLAFIWPVFVVVLIFGYLQK